MHQELRHALVWGGTKELNKSYKLQKVNVHVRGLQQNGKEEHRKTFTSLDSEFSFHRISSWRREHTGWRAGAAYKWITSSQAATNRKYFTIQLTL